MTGAGIEPATFRFSGGLVIELRLFRLVEALPIGQYGRALDTCSESLALFWPYIYIDRWHTAAPRQGRPTMTTPWAVNRLLNGTCCVLTTPRGANGTGLNFGLSQSLRALIRSSG